jgi:hypothetical protein
MVKPAELLPAINSLLGATQALRDITERRKPRTDENIEQAIYTACHAAGEGMAHLEDLKAKLRDAYDRAKQSET